MKRILLATDGSENSQQAASFLAHLPHDDKIEVTVVSVLYLPGAGQEYLAGDLSDAVLEQAQENAQAAYSKVERLFTGANVSLSHVIRQGHPAEAIVEVAKELESELLVVGAKGHTVVQRVLLGSTSDYVATHAPCSVLVVRPTELTDAKHRLRVAIGYEETGPAQAAVEEFADFKWGTGTQVRLVSVFYQPDFFDAPIEKPTPEFVEEAAAQLHDVAPDTKGCLIESNHIGEGLVRFAEENDVNLLMVGETPRTRLSRMLMGSKTRYVLRHAPCSVWITCNRMIHGNKYKASRHTESNQSASTS